MPPAKMEDPCEFKMEGGEREKRGEEVRQRVGRRRERREQSSSLSLSFFQKSTESTATHSHVLPPREEPQRRPGPDGQGHATQEEHVAHREQPAVEEEGDAEEREEHAKGGEADADFCFSFFVLFLWCRLSARGSDEGEERVEGARERERVSVWRSGVEREKRARRRRRATSTGGRGEKKKKHLSFP